MRTNIEAERARKKLTQVEIARLLGIAPKTYSNYVKGQAIPSTILIRMAELFECSTDYLLNIHHSDKSA